MSLVWSCLTRTSEGVKRGVHYIAYELRQLFPLGGTCGIVKGKVLCTSGEDLRIIEPLVPLQIPSGGTIMGFAPRFPDSTTFLWLSKDSRVQCRPTRNYWCPQAPSTGRYDEEGEYLPECDRP